jgi:predicted Zn-dependent protease
MVGLAQTLVGRVTILPSDDPKSDITRAEDLAEQAVVAEPGNSAALDVKANVFFAKRQWPQAIAEAEAAIADNPNNADAMLYTVSGRCFSVEARTASPGSKQRFV